jgi:Uncharacterized protein conserved in bacteria (DUF2125)
MGWCPHSQAGRAGICSTPSREHLAATRAIAYEAPAARPPLRKMEEFVRKLLPVVPCLLLASPALAQTVDAAGAQRLTDDLARYVSKGAFDHHIVSVELHGDAYRIAIDFKALSALVAPMDHGAKIDLAPLAVLAKPRADGTWDVTSDSLPTGSMEVDGPQGHQFVQWSIEGGTFTGLFDPALAAFRSMSGSQTGMTMSTKEAKQEVHATIGPGTFTLTGTPSAVGGIDFTLSEAFTNFTEIVQAKDESTGADFPMTLKAANLSVNGAGQGYRSRALLDLIAFGIANADEAKMKANQAALKDQLRAVLPGWNHLDMSYSFGDFSVETPMGNFGAGKLGAGVGMDGAVQNGTIKYNMSATGISAPVQLLPPWSQRLVPTEFDFNVSGVGFNLDSMAHKLIDNLDLNREPPIPQEVSDQIAAEFMANPPKLVISKSTVKNSDTEVTAEGEMTFPSGKPQANVAFEVAGYDKVVDAVKQAATSQPDMTQVLAVALAAKGFAKTQPDGRLRWELMVKDDGSVSVNGVTLKGPDEVQPQ